MRISKRPSKAFLFEAVKAVLKHERTGVGIDAACGTMKNRPVFKGEWYVGLDIEPAALKKGLDAFPEPAVIGVIADLTSLEGFPAGTGAAVVCTSTLHRIDPGKRLDVVDRLIRMTSPAGVLVCAPPRDETVPAIEARLRAAFADVKVVSYRNVLSRAFERVLEPRGLIRDHRPVVSPILQVASWCLVRLEHLTSLWTVGNDQLCFVCRNRRSDDTEPFSLSKFPLVGDRLRNALGSELTWARERHSHP